MERKQLYRMIDDRVDRMVEDGLAAEAGNLVRRGYSWDLPSMSGVGYKEMGAYLGRADDLGRVRLPHQDQDP